MVYFYGKKILKGLLSRKNWENSISRVCVEACDCSEDPLGYRAVYYVEEDQCENIDKVTSASFVVGASFLVKREHNLKRSGYNAPMTHRAIALIQNSTGIDLSASGR